MGVLKFFLGLALPARPSGSKRIAYLRPAAIRGRSTRFALSLRFAPPCLCTDSVSLCETRFQKTIHDLSIAFFRGFRKTKYHVDQKMFHPFSHEFALRFI